MTIKYTLTNNPNFSDVVSLSFCISEDYPTAREAHERLSYLLSILDPESVRAQPPTIRRRWTDAEIAVILGAVTHNEAIQRYRTQFPTSTRTEYSITKKLTKLRRTEPVEVKASDIKIPVSTGNEVTLHEPVEEVPEPKPIKKKKAYKNAWTPEEDAVVSSAPTIKDAITQYVARFGTKRSDMAIQSRWYVLNPVDKRLQEPHQKGIAQTPKEHTTASNPELPERGAIVSIAEDMGRIRTGQAGKVIRRDTIVGEVLVDFGAGNGGCVWMTPEKVAVLEKVE